MLYYSLLGLVPLAGIGANKLIIFTKKKSGYIALILIFIILFTTFYNYNKQPEGMELYYLIDDNEFKAAEFLEKQEKGKIISTPEFGSALPAITSKQVVADLVFKGSKKARNNSREFFISDCKTKKDIIDKLQLLNKSLVKTNK